MKKKAITKTNAGNVGNKCLPLVMFEMCKKRGKISYTSLTDVRKRGAELALATAKKLGVSPWDMIGVEQLNYTVFEWYKTKKIYRFDKDFLEVLVNTDKLEVNTDVFRFLPYENLYFDLKGMTEIGKKIQDDILYEGLFVNVEETADEFIITAFPVNKDRYNGFFMRFEKGTQKKTYGDTVTEHGLHTDYLEKLVLQILTYFASDKPDIVEGMPETKKGVKTGGKKKSEVTEYKVGFRFGTAFRKAKADEKKNTNTAVGNGMGGKKKPHIRQAHWHYYWHGSKKDVRVKKPHWLPPILVNTDNSDNIDVVSHKVK